MRGKTIQIFLTDGSPRGIKTAEITSNNELATFIPRTKINEALKRKEVSSPGVYFLFGIDESSTEPVIYIGQSRNCLERIKSHDQKKDFWNYVVIITSKTNSFSQTHIEFLEELAISKAIEANRYRLKNAVNPKKFDVSEMLEADLLDNFDTIKILLSTLSFTIYEKLESFNHTDNKKILTCKGTISEGKGEYVNDGFVVFKGSTARKEITPSAMKTITPVREKLIMQGVFIDKGDNYEFTKNYLFNSPSAASDQVLGRSSNGWLTWKSNKGETLDELERKELNSQNLFN